MSIQAKAQERAVMLVQAWATKAQVDIGNIRYHLLRNGLILHDIRIERGLDKLLIEHILMQASPESLNSSAAHIGKVDITGLEAEYHHINSSNAWQNDQMLMALWQASTSINMQGGRFTLYLQEQDEKPLLMNTFSIQQRMQSHQRVITASALTNDGAMQWHVSIDHSNNSSDGQFSWQHVNAHKWFEALALQPTSGSLSGELTWRNKHSQELNMQGELRFEAEQDDASKDNDTSKGNAAYHDQPIQRLQFDASLRNRLWDMHINAQAWPLDIWRKTLPDIAGRQWHSARWYGSSHWQGQPGKWSITSDTGVLHNIIFSNPSANATADWSWEKVSYGGLHLDTMQQYLHVSRLALNNGSLTVNAGTTWPIASKKTADRRDWNIGADHIQLHEITLNIALPEGSLSIQSLTGAAAWPQRQDFSFKLKTALANDATQTQWQLRGTAARQATSLFSDADFSLRGQYIPINYLRLLLPIQGDANSPVGLAGSMELRSTISVQQGRWQMRGQATMHDVQISHTGDTWMAEQISSQFGPIGMGLENQHIEQLNIDRWSYIASLEPLQAIHIDQPPVSMQQTSWWRSALRDNHIRIRHINLNEGSISIGQQDALWADQLNIQIDNLGETQAATIAAKANVSGGKFDLSGHWHALSEPQQFRGTASLQDATPFFLHPWMTASAMPRLIQGRLNAQINIHDGDHENNYQSQWKFQLRGALTEALTYATDPMLTLSGLNTAELLRHLARPDGTVLLQGNISGSWQERALDFGLISQSVQIALRQAANRDAVMLKTSETPVSKSPAAHIRLHGREVLSLNERGRLIKIVRLLRRNPNMSIDLIPQWTGSKLDSDILKRIQRTQELIERYMLHRKINKQRIFPRWPTALDQVDEISSIQVVLKP
ncbi:MAG: hypothetical protein JKY87_03270 [Mariprofundus sp.]|nr:hypothetical protein [Mariprofundus sp.]